MYDFLFKNFNRLIGKPLIYVIGDSHTTVFKNKLPFVVCHIGAPTMFNLARKNNSTHSNEKLFKILKSINSKKDYVMMVFGEIDCRIHIYYQYEKQEKKVTVDELIDKTILNYGTVLEKIRSMGIKLCVYGIPATGTQENYYQYPFYGTRQIRAEICRKFNGKLKNFCQKNNYPFIDIYPKISDDRGFLQKEFSADEVHLNEKVINLVKTELKKNKFI